MARVAAGHSRRTAARHFAVGDSSAISLMQTYNPFFPTAKNEVYALLIFKFNKLQA